MTDPDSGLFYKNEKERCLAYSFHTACDCHGFVVGVEVTGANVHDSTMLEKVLERSIENVGKPEAVAADAGYKTPYNVMMLMEQDIRPVLPYTRPHTKDGFYKKYEYVYDEYFDVYICPQGRTLDYLTTDRDGYRQYKTHPKTCPGCPDINKCTNGKEQRKLITRHIFAGYQEEAEHLGHTWENKMIYKARKETIERVFADVKEKQRLRYTRYRGLRNLKRQALLAFACHNLRKLAKKTWKSMHIICIYRLICRKTGFSFRKRPVLSTN